MQARSGSLTPRPDGRLDKSLEAILGLGFGEGPVPNVRRVPKTQPRRLCFGFSAGYVVTYPLLAHMFLSRDLCLSGTDTQKLCRKRKTVL
jgi:hypothetical protein